VARATTTEVMKVECVTDASLEALRMRRTDECSSSGGPSLWADATLEGAAPYSDPDTLAWLPMVCVALDDSPQDLATDEPGDALLRYYAVQSPPRPPTENTREKGPDFYTNAGDAIRTLRRELPNLFYQELTYDIYREDIVFRDPRNTFAGLDRYKLIFKTVRVFGRIFFRPRSLQLEILRIWQPTEHKIVIRWQIHGEPWQMPGFSTETRLDGTSEFKLDRNGKIYEHKVDTKTMAPESYLNVLSSMLNLSMARTPSTPTPSFFSRWRHLHTNAGHPSSPTAVATTASLHNQGEEGVGKARGKTSPGLAVLTAVWHVVHGNRRIDAPPGGSGA